MANIKSAAKRAKVAKIRTLRNKSIMSSVKTAIKNFEAAAAANDTEKATATFKTAISAIDKAVTKGLLHKNNAAHKKSRLHKMFNQLVG